MLSKIIDISSLPFVNVKEGKCIFDALFFYKTSRWS